MRTPIEEVKRNWTSKFRRWQWVIYKPTFYEEPETGITPGIIGYISDHQSHFLQMTVVIDLDGIPEIAPGDHLKLLQTDYENGFIKKIDREWAEILYIGTKFSLN